MNAKNNSFTAQSRGISSAYELTDCDREQIQFPNAVMPHGVLLVVTAGEFLVIGSSANSSTLLGLDAGQILGQPLDFVTGPVVAQAIRASLSALVMAATPCLIGCFETLHGNRLFSVLGHRSGNVFILEFEAINSNTSVASVIGHSAQVKNSLSALQAADNWQTGMEIAVRELKQLTGFDSVLGVRFLDDGSFQAVAEAREAHIPSYLDKRFPRSDIPEPGRRQMLVMPQQYMPDLFYEPVPIIMSDYLETPQTLDLTYAALRSVSPICRRFYQNMGIRSRLLLSLVNNGKLWGFINCWSDTRHSVSYVDRLAYQGFADTAALLLIEKEKTEQQQQALSSKRHLMAIANTLNEAADFNVALRNLPHLLVDKLDVDGVVLVTDGFTVSAGQVPEPALINVLIPWLEKQPECFMTDKLASLFEPAGAYGSSAAGLLAIRLLQPGQYLLGFRPEWVYEVAWAGNPEKPMVIDADNGQPRLTPRGSFEEWKQVVKGCARPWLDHEQEAWRDLHKALLFGQNAEKNQILKVRLEESNGELESFAYIVSHDLQEPLRGIQNFSQLLSDENNGQTITDDQRMWLNVIINLSARMHNQIEALLQYSRANQQVLNVTLVNLNQLLMSVREDLATRIAKTNTQIVIPRPLPEIYCDAVRIRAVFENLITNAVKYNDQSEKRVEIGYTETTPLTFYVRDNGIGIKDEHRQMIFTIFRRLHGRNDYGGGTGAGLTITQKHIERQGGKIWLESAPDRGTTFYFTIAPEFELMQLASASSIS